MKTVALRTPERSWEPAGYRFGEGSTYIGATLTREKILSDRR